MRAIVLVLPLFYCVHILIRAASESAFSAMVLLTLLHHPPLPSHEADVTGREVRISHGQIVEDSQQRFIIAILWAAYAVYRYSSNFSRDYDVGFRHPISSCGTK